MSDIKYETYTEDQNNIHEIVWTMPNFMDLLENESTREFRTDKLNKDAAEKAIDSKFQLKMKFQGRYNDIIEIYYLSTNSVFLKLTLTNSRGTSMATEEYHKVQANRWQYSAKLSKDNCRYYQLRQDGCLQLTFVFTVSNVIKFESSNVSPDAQLSHDFENLLSNGLFSDVTVKSSDGDKYKVHKVVLASRSAVLKAHFEHNTVECQMNVIESPLESEVLIEVLTFIYSDKAPRIDEIPERLLAAADYYQLRGLKSLCEEALHKRLTVENAIETLQLADLHSAKILKQLTLEFIKDGQANLITKTEGWAKFKSVELIKTICEFITADDVEAEC